jgi:hypothetical protein
MDVNQPPVPASLIAAVEAAAQATQPTGDDLLDVADELTYLLEGGLPYLNVVKINPTDDPRRRLMGTSFCRRVKEAEDVVEDLQRLLSETFGEWTVRSAGFAIDDQAYIDFVLGAEGVALPGRLRITVYG